MNDEQLLKAFRSGNREAFNQLYANNSDDLRKFLRRKYFRDENAIDEVCAAAWLRLLTEELNPAASFRPWFFTMAASLALNLISST